MLRIYESALRHDCTREDISTAYDMKLYEATLDAEADPPKLLFIGPDPADNLLELVGAELENGDVLIWHAMKCRKQFLDLLARKGGTS